MASGKEYVSETVSETYNEKRKTMLAKLSLKDGKFQNGRFLLISETVSENGNEKVRNDARWHSEDASASVSDTEAETDNEKGRFLPILETVSNNGDEKEKNVAHKIASERWKVSEWKVRIAHEIEKKAINARWHPDKEYVSDTVSETYNEKVKNDARKIAAERWKVSEWKVLTNLGDCLRIE